MGSQDSEEGENPPSKKEHLEGDWWPPERQWIQSQGCVNEYKGLFQHERLKWNSCSPPEPLTLMFFMF